MHFFTFFFHIYWYLTANLVHIHTVHGINISWWYTVSDAAEVCDVRKDPDSHCAARRRWLTVSHLIVTELLIIPIPCDSSLVVTKQHIFCLRVKQKRQQPFFFSFSVARPRGVVLKLMWATWHLSQHSGKQKMCASRRNNVLIAKCYLLMIVRLSDSAVHISRMHTKPLLQYRYSSTCMHAHPV